MKLVAADFAKVQLSLLAALLMTAAGAGTVLFTLNLTKTAKLNQAAAQAERDDFDGKLRRVRGEEAEIKQKSALFKRLQERGVIGEEQRLEWVELLKEIRDKRRLLDLQYEIAPQRPLDAMPANGYGFYASTMKVQLKLLHEEDLTRLLDDLRRQARALIQVKSCAVSRLPRGGADGTIPAQLQAECQIDLVTLRAAAGREERSIR
jgi:cell division protein FtsL